MSLLSEHPTHANLGGRLREAHAVTAELLSDLIGETCLRFPSAGRSEAAARIERLIGSEAWTEVTLTLIDLEMPQWQVRRIAYGEGEWHCALSRQRELPEWLDQSIEARHVDLPLAILSAFVDAQRINALPTSRTSVPTVPRNADALYEPAGCENFA